MALAFARLRPNSICSGAVMFVKVLICQISILDEKSMGSEKAFGGALCWCLGMAHFIC